MSDTVIRTDAIYVSWQTRRALNMLGRATGSPPDMIANDVLQAWLIEHHPEVADHIAAQQKSGAEFEAALKTKLAHA